MVAYRYLDEERVALLKKVQGLGAEGAGLCTDALDLGVVDPRAVDEDLAARSWRAGVRQRHKVGSGLRVWGVPRSILDRAGGDKAIVEEHVRRERHLNRRPVRRGAMMIRW